MAFDSPVVPLARSAILRLPAHLRTDALNKLSANANAAGGARKQYQSGAGVTAARPNQTAARGLRNALGIYLIETNFTGPYAATVSAATPGTITIEGGTPASTVIATNEQDAVTWVAPPGPRSLTFSQGTEVLGNTKVVVGP